jgi:hypothetical protein
MYFSKASKYFAEFDVILRMIIISATKQAAASPVRGPQKGLY